MRLTLPVTFAAILFVLTIGLFPIVDPDFFWHVKIGELILQSSAIPSKELFSHTAYGQPWIVQGWLFDVILDSVWRSAGILGIRLLVFAMLISTWGLIYRTACLYLARKETALVLSIFGVAMMAPLIAPRSNMVTALGLALTLYSLLSFRRSGEQRWLYILPLVFALWPNLHFGYIVGVGLVALFVFSDLLGRALPIARNHVEKGTLIAFGPALIGLLCVVAVGANPLGYRVLWDTVWMSLQGASSPISEWQTPSFADGTGKLVYAAICLLFFARAFAHKSIHWLDLVVPLVFIGAGLSALRHISLMGIVLVPFAARALASWNGHAFVIAGSKTRRFGAAASRDLGPRASALINLVFIVLAVFGTLLLKPLAEREFGELRALYQPSGAADFLVDHDLKGRLFNTYNGGGYLIYRLYPRQQVFIDGRFNVFPKRVFDDYQYITGGKPGWFLRLENYEIDIVISETIVPFRQLMLLRKEFRLVYEDPYFSVLVRNNDQFRHLPTVEPAIPQ